MVLLERESGDWVRGVKRLLVSEIQQTLQAWVATPEEDQDEFLSAQDIKFKEISKV